MLVAASIFYFAGRSGDRQIRISTNPWVGFTPFIYAQEKGWLEKTPFRFLWLVDLTENARLYDRKFTQGFTATQFELLHFKDYSHLKPIFLIDRSAGADAILSNISLTELRKAPGNVTVYLELGSMNEDFFSAFIKEYQLSHLKFEFTNSSQKAISQLTTHGSPIIVVSYAPYVSDLIARGFFNIASTKTIQSFFVIDALFMDERFVVGREDEYRQLKVIFERALDQFKTDPHAYYQTINGYLEGQSYDEFMATTAQIAWLTKGDQTPYLQQLQAQSISTNRLLP